MTRDEIRTKIAQEASLLLLVGGLPDDITDATHLVNDLGADEIDLLEFSLELEMTFGIDIPETDEPKILVIRDAVDYVGARLGVPT